jgi:hypothetical protein
VGHKTEPTYYKTCLAHQEGAKTATLPLVTKCSLVPNTDAMGQVKSGSSGDARVSALHLADFWNLVA